MYNQTNLSKIQIETERLIIKPFHNSDFEDSVNIYGDNKITKYFDFGVPRSRNEVKDMINYYCGFFEKYKFCGIFSIFKKENMKFVGHIDCIPSNQSRTLEIGFILKYEFQNIGIGFEAVKAFLYEYIKKINNANDPNGFIQIVATAHPNNIKSIKLLEKLNMKLDCKILKFNKQPRYKYFLEI